MKKPFETDSVTFSWRQLEPDSQVGVMNGLADHLGIQDKDSLMRIFQMIQPKIIVGTENGQAVARIHPDYQHIMKINIRAYVEK